MEEEHGLAATMATRRCPEEMEVSMGLATAQGSQWATRGGRRRTGMEVETKGGDGGSPRRQRDEEEVGDRKRKARDTEWRTRDGEEMHW